MTFDDLCKRIGESGAARASVKGETQDGKAVSAIRANADGKAVSAYLDAKGDDLTAFQTTFKGHAVKVTAKRGDRAATDTVIL